MKYIKENNFYYVIRPALYAFLVLGTAVSFPASIAQSQESSGEIRIIDLSKGGNQKNIPSAPINKNQTQKEEISDKNQIRIIRGNKTNPPVSSSEQAKVTLRYATHERYDRLVFDWNTKTDYKPHQEGALFTISFNQSGSIDLSRLTANLPLIENVEKIENDPLSITLRMKKNVVPDTFNVGNRVVIDFKRDLVSPSTTKTLSETDLKKDVQKTATDVQTKSDTDLKPKIIQSPPDQMIPSSLPKAGLQPIEEDIQAVELETPRSNARFQALEKAKQEIKNSITRLSKGDIISVSSLEPMGLAVFVRGGHLWIVQSEKRQSVPPVLRQSRQVESRSIEDQTGVTKAWLFPIDEGLKPQVKMGDFSWEITLSDDYENTKSLPVITEKSIYKNKEMELIRVKMNQDSQVLRFIDPFVGDEIIAVPVYLDDLRVYRATQMTKFSFISASVGIALKPMSDGLDVFVEEKDLFIAHLAGLTLSSQKMKDGPEKVKTQTSIRTLFDIPSWLITTPSDFQEHRRELEKQISLMKSEKDKVKPLLKLSQLYFANGLPHEALGYVRFIEQIESEMKRNPSFLAFKSIVYSLAGKHKDALELLSNTLISNEPELALWRAYNLANQGEWKAAYDNFSKTGNLIVHYPEPIRSQMILVLAEAAVNVYDAVNAQTLVGLIEEKDNKSLRESSAVRYLQARLALLNRDTDEAERLFKLETNSLDRFYRAKSALELLKLRRRLGEMDNERAIDVLERLRYVWRDDAFEIEVLETLGDAYLENKNYRMGLMRLRGIVPLVEDDQQKTDEITTKLTKYFNKLFVEDDASNLPPLTALALYNEFSELTPVGREGDVAIQKLAERMVEIDLLDRAAKLLEHQVKFRLKGEDAIHVGNRLAAIYLLDSNPEKALQALDETKEGNVPLAMKEERKLLRARAYSQMNDPDKAIEILSGMDSEIAHRLNVDVNWKAGRWEQAALAINPLLNFMIKENNLRNEQGKIDSLTEDAAGLVLNQAVAYILAGQLGNVRRLASEYETAMEKTSNAPLFRLITRAPKPGELADFQTLQTHVGEVDLFKGFLDAYKTSSNAL